MALALNRFKTYTATLTTSSATIYTAPTGYTGIILYAHITNYAAAATTLTMSHVRSSTTTQIISGSNVPVNDAYIPLDGKLVLETSDYIVAQAGASLGLGPSDQKPLSSPQIDIQNIDLGATDEDIIQSLDFLDPTRTEEVRSKLEKINESYTIEIIN